jgi:hypothetical protein
MTCGIPGRSRTSVAGLSPRRRGDADLADLADLDLLLVAERAPLGTLCLTSALARHELTDEIPSACDIALPRGAWRPYAAPTPTPQPLT